jgi:hypothetical protein
MERNALDPSSTTSATRTRRRDTEGVALCFKVPFEFRRRFKLEAVRRNLSMTELLIRAAESYLLAEAEQTEPVVRANGHE